MKKFFIAAIALIATAGTFTSCDPDDDQGMALSGCWDGDFGMSYDYEYRGRVYTEDADYTDIQFYPSEGYYDRGYGYQVDFYEYGPWDEVYHSFTWRIQNGVVYLDYCSEHQLSTDIYDYEMTNNYFTGYFGDSHTRFSLRKYEDYFNWTPYINTYGDYRRGNGYGYSEWDDWGYYARTRFADGATGEDSAAEAPKLIRVYNRHSAK